MSRIQNRIPRNFPIHVLEDVKSRVLMCLQKPQREDYFSTEENIKKMKSKRHILGNGKTFKEDYPYLQTSFYTRVAVTEVLFGNPRNEEPNLAYSICKSLDNVSKAFCL